MPNFRTIAAQKLLGSRRVATLTASAQTDVDISAVAGVYVLRVQFTTVPTAMRVAVSTSSPYAAPSLSTNVNALSATGFMVNKTCDLRIESKTPITGFHVYNSHASTTGECMLELYGA